MKNLIFLTLTLFVIILTQSSCSNEVEVVGLWKDIPVVYAVVSNQDSVSYIRIERAYLPPNKSAYEVAQISDSLYFDPADVDITMFHIVNGDTVPWPYPLERVNLIDEGVVRDTGIFANNPAYAYKMLGVIERPLLLKIDNQKTNNVFWSYTESVYTSTNDDFYTQPTVSVQPFYPLSWRTINSQNEEVYANLAVAMTGNGFASIYDYKVLFHYQEYQIDNNGNEIGGTRSDKSLEWKAISDFVPSDASLTKKTLSGESFYRYVGANLSDVTGTNLRRCAGKVEIYIDGGSESLKLYIEARQANEGFVGGLYPADPYSNVEGGFGVFATGGRLERKDRLNYPRMMQLSDLSIEHFKFSSYTVNLGFENVTACN